MPRRSRCVLLGVPHHITQRGVDKCETFSTEGNSQTYLRLLRDNLSDAKVRLLGWCMMSNHVHVITSIPFAHMAKSVEGAAPRRFQPMSWCERLATVQFLMGCRCSLRAVKRQGRYGFAPHGSTPSEIGRRENFCSPRHPDTHASILSVISLGASPVGSQANSNKDHTRQGLVCRNVAAQIARRRPRHPGRYAGEQSGGGQATGGF